MPANSREYMKKYYEQHKEYWKYDPVTRREYYLRTRDQTLKVNSVWRNKHKSEMSNWHKNGLHFKGKYIHLDRNPRSGKCSSCGKEGYTQIHHDQYDEKDPLANTRELCPKCHTGLRYQKCFKEQNAEQ